MFKELNIVHNCPNDSRAISQVQLPTVLSTKYSNTIISSSADTDSTNYQKPALWSRSNSEVTVCQPACVSANQTVCLSASQQASQIKRKTCSQNRNQLFSAPSDALALRRSTPHLTLAQIRPRFLFFGTRERTSDGASG